MLKVDKLSRTGLAPASLMLPAGAIGVLTGPSGAGKSLLARAIVDLDPNDGEVWWKGRARSAMPAPAWRRLIGYVPAESGWWAERVGAHFANPSAMTPLLEAVGLPADAMDWPLARASTGERQRLALLRALEAGPEVLILDEPTSALDEETRQRVEDLILAQRRNGLTFLVITHDPAQAARLGDIFWRIENGRVTLKEEPPA
jgi:phosphate-transporting ATPase